MASFSERYGYTKPSNVIIREKMPDVICNSIINWMDYLKKRVDAKYSDLEIDLWLNYFNDRLSVYDSRTFYRGERIYSLDVFQEYITSNALWYEKLNLLEYTLTLFDKRMQNYIWSIGFLNSEFERHNFAYRIIDGKVEEITSKVEIQSIEEAINTSDNGVKTHLKAALEFLSASNKTPDYRNSIKESISAVEAICRKLTGANDLGKALSQLEKNGITIQPMLKKGIEYLYHYSNDKTTGIRHSLIEKGYTPTSEDAIFMLVTCSAFINFLKKKNGN